MFFLSRRALSIFLSLGLGIASTVKIDSACAQEPQREQSLTGGAYKSYKALVKSLFMTLLKLEEPSTDMLESAQEALHMNNIMNNITHDVIIVQDPNPDARYGAYVVGRWPFSFMVISTKNWHASSPSARTFTLYHECGHLRHEDYLSNLINPFIPFTLGYAFIQFNFITSHHTLFYERNMLIERVGTVLLAALYLASFKLIYKIIPHDLLIEKRADLFACSQLIKQGHTDIVFDEIRQLRQEDLGYYSHAERARYLQECVNKYAPKNYTKATDSTYRTS
jgi:hypothetical protein